MNYIIFDMEWNQPMSSGAADPNLRHGEIIQIGFFVLNDALEITHSEEINIRPVCYTVMNMYVSTLTGIKQKDIDGGTDFKTAIGRMASFFTDDTVIITWGDDDLPLLKENLSYHDMAELSLPKHYNLQRIYAMQHEEVMTQTGLKTAMAKLGITADVHAHDALNDAYMTVLVARKLDLAIGMAEYEKRAKPPKEAFPALPWTNALPLYTLTVPYPGSIDGMAEVCRKMPLSCPKCRAALFVSVVCRQGKHSFIGLPSCESCGVYFVRFELKDGGITASCFVNNGEFEAIYLTKLREKEKRLKYRKIYKNRGKKSAEAAALGEGAV